MHWKPRAVTEKNKAINKKKRRYNGTNYYRFLYRNNILNKKSPKLSYCVEKLLRN